LLATYVQEPVLFATTINGNIKYGNPFATQEEIEEAARLANAHEFITSFSEGYVPWLMTCFLLFVLNTYKLHSVALVSSYNTQVGDKGSQLSGGQKQRIAIARVLVGKPRILLLDEATSALDAESELIVQDVLERILKEKRITTIIVAHRLSTIRNADKIGVVVGGRVQEEGTHDELMSLKSYYRRLVERQDGNDDENPVDSNASSRRGSASDLDSVEVTLGAAETGTVVPHIEFRNVSFNYPSRPGKTVLSDFSLVVEQGQTVALVGRLAVTCTFRLYEVDWTWSHF